MQTMLLEDPYGVNHSFLLYSQRHLLPSQSGIYAVVKYDELRMQYEVLYIGKCEDFRARHSCHHKMLDFLLRGATHIGVHFMPNAQNRTELELQLIDRYRPPLNNVPALAGLRRR